MNIDTDRTVKRCNSSTGVHLEDVCWAESGQWQDHLLALHMCDWHGEYPICVRCREGHHPPTESKGVQFGVAAGWDCQCCVHSVSTLPGWHGLLFGLASNKLTCPLLACVSLPSSCGWFTLSVHRIKQTNFFVLGTCTIDLYRRRLCIFFSFCLTCRARALNIRKSL